MRSPKRMTLPASRRFLADYTGHHEVIVSYYGDGENLSAAPSEALGSLGFCPQAQTAGCSLIGIMDRTGMLFDEESSPERYLTYNNAPFPDFSHPGAGYRHRH